MSVILFAPLKGKGFSFLHLLHSHIVRKLSFSLQTEAPAEQTAVQPRDMLYQRETSLPMLYYQTIYHSTLSTACACVRLAHRIQIGGEKSCTQNEIHTDGAVILLSGAHLLLSHFAFIACERVTACFYTNM